MCAAELTWYFLKVYNWSLMKHTWWNWQAVPGTAYWNMGHTAGTLRKIGIYFILRNNWHIDVPWNISKIFYWMYFFLFNTWFRYWIVWYFVQCILQIVRIANWGTWLAHTLCRVWYEIIKIVEHSLDFHLESCKHFDEVENVSGIFFDWYRILFWNLEICTISLFSFGWWYTLMKNKHQISLYLGLKKMANILQITFSNGFSLKKIISVCLSVCLPARPQFHFTYADEMMHKAWYCLGVVPYWFSRSSVKFRGHTAKKNHWFRPKLGVSRLYLQFEFTDGYEMMHKVWSSIEEMPHCFSRLSVKFQGHRAKKNIDFDPKLGFFGM